MFGVRFPYLVGAVGLEACNRMAGYSVFFMVPLTVVCSIMDGPLTLFCAFSSSEFSRTSTIMAENLSFQA